MLAVCEMVALHQKVPFRRDTILKALENQFRRDKGVTLELIGGLCELLGMTCQLAKTATLHINSVEAPAILFLEEVPVILYGVAKGKLIVCHPHQGIKKIELKDIENKLGDEIQFVLPRRNFNNTNKPFWMELVYATYQKIQDSSYSSFCIIIVGPSVWPGHSASIAADYRQSINSREPKQFERIRHCNGSNGAFSRNIASAKDLHLCGYD